MILAFSPTNCFQTRAYLFGNAFALQLEIPANGKFTTARSNPVQVTYSHHYKLTVYLPLKHLLTQILATGSSTSSYWREDSHISSFLHRGVGGKAANYRLAFSFLCPMYWLLWGSLGKGRFKLLWPHCRWIWPCPTFSLVVWAGHSPRYAAYGPAKLRNMCPGLSPMSPWLH